jgi:TolA-binding protein
MRERILFFAGLLAFAALSVDAAPTAGGRAAISRAAATPARISIGSYVKKQVASGAVKPPASGGGSSSDGSPSNSAALADLENQLDDLKSQVQDLADTTADLSNYWTIAETEAALDEKQDSLPSSAGNIGKVLSVGSNGLEWVSSAGMGNVVFTGDIYTDK